MYFLQHVVWWTPDCNYGWISIAEMEAVDDGTAPGKLDDYDQVGEFVNPLGTIYHFLVRKELKDVSANDSSPSS